MKLASLEDYKKRQRAAIRRNKLLLLVLAAISAALWLWAGSGLTVQERGLMSSVLNAQEFLYNLRVQGGSEFKKTDDPYRTGFIGLEWSSLSTTLGAAAARHGNLQKMEFLKQPAFSYKRRNRKSFPVPPFALNSYTYFKNDDKSKGKERNIFLFI